LKKKSILKATLVTTASFIMLIGAPISKAEFTDLKPNHWCYEKILDFADKNYIIGYGDGTFRPSGTITKAEFISLVNNFF